jgi:beta-barrel assembly-enhancing protease
VRRGAGLVALSLAATLVAACAAPRPGPGGVADLAPEERPADRSDEASLWLQADRLEEQLEASPSVVRDPALQAYVRGVVCRIAGPHCPRIRVYLIRDPEFNASMAPNGLMQIRTGLLLRLANEAQLAHVLGHEIEHYLRRHSMQRWEDFQAKAINLRAEVGSLAAFSRDQEREADQLSSELMVKSGYDPREAPRAWERFMAERAGRSTAPSNIFLATHPPTAERVTALWSYAEKTAGGAGEPRVGRDDYVAQLRAARRWMLRDELRRRQFASSETLLRFLVEDGDGLGELHFYEGELHRLRGALGDLTRSVAAYRRALELPDAPPETQRSLGFVYARLEDRAAARTALARYLEDRPDAPDRALIESQIAELAAAR